MDDSVFSNLPNKVEVCRQFVINFDILELPIREARRQFEIAYLSEIYIKYKGNVGKCAKFCGYNREHMYDKLKAYNIYIRGKHE